MKKTLHYLVTIIVILVIVVFAWQYVKKSSIASRDMEKSIAILPFGSQSTDKENQYLVEGSIKKQNDSVEIQVQIIDSLTRDEIWSKTFISSENELPEIYEKIEKEIMETMILLE